MKRATFLAALLVSSLVVGAEVRANAPATQPAGKIEICFVLDTTGSMSGLIEGAKLKIWSIANSIVAKQPKSKIRIALVGYRDRGDEYVTKKFDLTDDLDDVYKNLSAFQAGGGGDTPESVNQALHEAVNDIKWSGEKEVAKIIFLVGDAPPHMDYKDDHKYADSCQSAAKANIIINTVQCGSITETTPTWQEIAKLAEGTYVALGQSGDMVAIATPHDEELAKLNKDVNGTIIAYGAVAQQAAVRSKLALSEAAPATAAADRLYFNSNASKTVQGNGDLIDDLKDGSVKLTDVKESELPEDLRKLPADKRKEEIEKRQKSRSEIRTKIADVSQKRQQFIETENRKRAESGKGDSFDSVVSETVEKQIFRSR